MKRILALVALGAVGAVALASPTGLVATWNVRWLLSAAFSPDGLYVAVGTHYAVILYANGTWKEAARLSFPEASVFALSFSPDGTRLAATALSEVRVWDVGTGALLASLDGQFGRVLGVAFGPGETILLGGSDGSLTLWKLGENKPLWVKTPHKVQVQEVAFSLDGKLAASAGHDRAILWDTATWTELHSLPGKAWDVAFTPDGNFLVVGWGKLLRVWDTAVGLLYHNELWGHESCAIRVAVSADGTLLGSGSLDETARIWDLETGMCVAVIEGHGAVVQAVGFSPNGALFLTASDNGMVCIWDLATVLGRK